MPNLPNEVWVQIFGYFEYPFEAKSDQPAHEPRTVHEPWREGLRVLARCCRVSARFLGLARPVLYRRLPLEEEEIRLSSLLRTLAERPLLAQYVECIMQDNRHGLSLKAFRSLVGQYYDTPPNLSRSQRHNKRIRYTGPPPSLSSLEGFEAEVRCPSYSSRRQGGSEMWHAHCAGLMPNLKVFNCLITAKDKFIPAMIRQAADIGAVRAVEDAKDPHKESQETGLARIYQQDSGPTLGVPLPLAKLEELAVSHHRPTRMPTAAVSLEKFQDLFFLPRLIRFYGHGVTLNNTPAKDDQTSEQQRPRRVSSLAYVHLRSSFADAQSICNLPAYVSLLTDA
ncbi:hypothetical protein BDP55DRAFT_675113 [Colletotrichum godetiae]|uniref:F-box domain-containing protein n=1 Tax=Colletotrichum godetiae TaxID=1209918 RepID=A0AAJ0AD78_9PEZI|nr:uncharacterized protein BDP55DRAFT_675113 [Colletotrichum godetiae]KAK1671667.1 hypothetical protein BDP55DRAFT_675113 [Colletotrichum godetiae]